MPSIIVRCCSPLLPPPIRICLLGYSSVCVCVCVSFGILLFRFRFANTWKLQHATWQNSVYSKFFGHLCECRCAFLFVFVYVGVYVPGGVTFCGFDCGWCCPTLGQNISNKINYETKKWGKGGSLIAWGVFFIFQTFYVLFAFCVTKENSYFEIQIRGLMVIGFRNITLADLFF